MLRFLSYIPLIFSFFRGGERFIILKTVLSIASEISKYTKTKKDDEALALIVAILDFNLKGLPEDTAKKVSEAVTKSNIKELKGLSVNYSKENGVKLITDGRIISYKLENGKMLFDKK